MGYAEIVKEANEKLEFLKKVKTELESKKPTEDNKILEN